MRTDNLLTWSDALRQRVWDYYFTRLLHHGMSPGNARTEADNILAIYEERWVVGNTIPARPVCIALETAPITF